MGRKSRSNQRSQLPKGRGEYYASFGFRHPLGNGNLPLYSFLESLTKPIDYDSEDPVRVEVIDPSKMSLKIVERYSLTRAAKRARWKLTKSDIGAIKQNVRIGLQPLDLNPSGLTVHFDRVAAVGGDRARGERRKLALLPALAQTETALLFDEHDVCMDALHEQGVPEIRYPSSEWIPHLSVEKVLSGPIERAEESAQERLESFGGRIAVQFCALEYYDEQTEALVS